jgi:hypothetical protein
MAVNKQITDLFAKTRMHTGDLLVARDILSSTSGQKDQQIPWSMLVRDFLTTEPVNWYGQLAKIELAVSGEQAVLAVIGDSWVQNGYITQTLNTYLQTTYGNAGDGYVGIGNDHGAPSSSVTYLRTGTWTDHDNGGSPQGNGVDIADANTTDTTTPAQVAISAATFNAAVIHYLKQTNGGDFRWRIDGGAWTTQATANAGNLYSTVTISSLSTAAHTLDIQALVAGSAGVTMFGADLQRTGNGVRLHRLGNGGATAAQYAAADATLWQAGLTALNPTAVAILLGTNDMSANVLPATFGGSIDTLCTRIRAALPLADIILLPSADNGLAGKTYTMAQYRDEMRNAAVRNSGLFIDTYASIGGYTNGNSRSLYLNTSHINANGGQVETDTIARRLKAK